MNEVEPYMWLEGSSGSPWFAGVDVTIGAIVWCKFWPPDANIVCELGAMEDLDLWWVAACPGYWLCCM